MITFRKLALATGLCAMGALGAGTAMAQSTDAFHTIQVFPVVVDTASFSQRFTFRNPNETTITISPTYLPGTGTSQGTLLNCPDFTVGANDDRTFSSLRTLCPALAAGSQFGMLYTYEINAANMPYAGFSRVANPQGNGFSVEAFAGNEFTAATSSVSGVRRLAASVSNPAFQTNCFVGKMLDIGTADTSSTDVQVSVWTNTGTQIGSTTTFPLTHGKMTRLLDVFAAVGAPAGDYDNVRVQFYELGSGEPGIMGFCTVQDNTSFGADFRIAKQEDPDLPSIEGPQDDHVQRNSTENSDVLGRVFEIAAVNGSANTHVIYVKHPDWIQCELIDNTTGLRALDAYGLEMRLLASDGTTVLAGGNEAVAFGEIYTGDKPERNFGANTRYLIQVENDGVNTASTRPYRIHCESGSGHSQMDLIEYKVARDLF